MSQKLNLQLFFRRWRAKFVQNLIFEGRLVFISHLKGLSFVLIIKRQDLNTVSVAAFEKSFVGTSGAAFGVRAYLVTSVRVLTNDAAAFAAHLHVFVKFSPEVDHVALEAFFTYGHKADLIAEFSESHGCEVCLDVHAGLKVIKILPERYKYLAGLYRLTIKRLSFAVLLRVTVIWNTCHSVFLLGLARRKSAWQVFSCVLRWPFIGNPPSFREWPAFSRSWSGYLLYLRSR